MRFIKAPQCSSTLLLLSLLTGCGPADSAPAEGRGTGDETADAPTVTEPSPVPVRPGIQVLLTDSLHLIRDRRVGLVTNHTGVFRIPGPAGAPDTILSSVDILFAHEEFDLVALFGPEHALEGSAEGGEKIPTSRHAATGLPVYSLYGPTREPLPHMLEGIDVLLFDIQDIGARYYTYVSTMAMAMRAAGARRIPFVVLDRPDPIGGTHVQGNVLDTAFASFVGLYPVPMRHGMTPGELARLYAGEFEVDVELRVVPAEGWKRELWFDETGLPWIRPSPNMPSLESATHYPGTCLFEGTNLSVGRGTERAFQWIGAPWLDGEALARRLRGYELPGVRIRAATFTPRDPGDGKYDGVTVEGVRLVVTDREAYDPARTGVAALLETRRMAGDEWRWRTSHFDRLAGTDRLRHMIEEGRPFEEIVGPWEEGLAAFRRLREPYLIYR